MNALDIVIYKLENTIIIKNLILQIICSMMILISNIGFLIKENGIFKINNNTNFFKEMEVLFKIVFNETYSTAYD